MLVKHSLKFRDFLTINAMTSTEFENDIKHFKNYDI